MSQHVVTGWPNASNRLGPTLLRCVSLKRRDRLVEASSGLASNVAMYMCCVLFVCLFIVDMHLAIPS